MEEKQPGNFPTFDTLEEVTLKQDDIETEEEKTAREAAELAAKENPTDDPKDPKDPKEPKKTEGDAPDDKNPYGSLDLTKTEASSDDDEEVTKEEAIDNFEKAVAMGIFQVPEGFEYDGSEEKTEEVHAYTMKVQEEKARTELFDKIQDPYLQHLVDYGMKAGEFANIQDFGKNLKEHLDASKIDITDTKQATDVVRKHLTDIGNSPKIVEKVIKDAIDDDELSEYAKEGQSYFVQKAEDKVTEAQNNDITAAKEYKIAQEQYEKQFMDTLKTKELGAEEKSIVLDSFNSVELNNGNKIPEYQYKIDQIKQNPGDFIELLGILGKYEAGKGFNLETASTKKTEAIKSIYETLNGKKATIAKSTGAPNSAQTKFVPTYVDTSTNI
jgi:hypothetical protein